MFSGSVFGDDLQDGLDAHTRGDYKTAYKLLAPLAEQGNAKAQFRLGVMYEHSLGVPQDYKTAVKWYRLSAEQGLAIAQSRLGFLHLLGIRGVQQDYKEAVKWSRLAAEQGNAIAQYFLGHSYADGQGVLQDYALAHMWFNLCGASGDDEDCVENRNRVEKKMTPSQIEKAQEMARNWKPKTM